MQIVRPTDKDVPYRGRFAPSPSGHLHFGSLITALASFLDARKNRGTWLVRIEDIDPPREQKGASQIILSTLEAFGLEWDGEVLFQSQQTHLYEEQLAALMTNQRSYYCHCTRAQIKAMGGTYLGDCRRADRHKSNAAIRIINDQQINDSQDLIQNNIVCANGFAQEDFIIKRRDGLYAYQLAVVIDDIYQGITHVIRGCDLLESTIRQLCLFNILQTAPPQYGHIPLAITDRGYKLSKQNNAPAIDVKHPQGALMQALCFLGQNPPLALGDCSVNEIIQWAIIHWQRALIPKKQKIAIN